MQVYKVTVDNNGIVSWYNERDELHREGGLPAVEGSDGYKAYYEHGKRHRLDGPAVEYHNGRKEYWIDGERLTKEEFDDRNKKELTVKQIEDILGYSIKIVKD